MSTLLNKNHDKMFKKMTMFLFLIIITNKSVINSIVEVSCIQKIWAEKKPKAFSEKQYAICMRGRTRMN